MKDESLAELQLTKSLAMNWDKAGAIVAVSGTYIGMILRIRPNRRIYIGRDYHDMDIVLEEDTISRCHCWIEYDDEQDCYRFWDCSKNGVTLNGTEQVEKETLLLLSHGDELRMAGTEHIFKLG